MLYSIIYATREDSDVELPEIISDSDSEDEASTDDEAEDIDEEELDFNPATAGRDHGLQKVPRFDFFKVFPLWKLRTSKPSTIRHKHQALL